MKTKIVISFIAALLVSPSLAGTSKGLITTPLVTYKDVFMFSAGAHSSAPDCATSMLGTWAVDLKTEHGKAMQAIVMSAHAQKKEVQVNGRQVCDVWGDRESINYLFIVE